MMQFLVDLSPCVPILVARKEGASTRNWNNNDNDDGGGSTTRDLRRSKADPFHPSDCLKFKGATRCTEMKRWGESSSEAFFTLACIVVFAMPR